MEIKFMEDKWDDFHSKEEFHTKYPSEHVVRFLFSQFSRVVAERKYIKILDAGCGAGRHTSLCATEGFDTYYTDISQEALKVTAERLRREGLKATSEKASVEKLPFADEFFDGLVSFGVLYYNDMNGLNNAISEIYRVLKKGGKAFVLTTTKDDYRCGKGKQVSGNTYLLDITDTNEEGMILHFLDEHEIGAVFNVFKEIGVGKSEVTIVNSQRKDSHWIIILKK